MAGNRKFPSDLLFVAGLVILTNIFVLIPVLSESFIRTLISLPMLLFLPGYALISTLFPEKDRLEGKERVALSIAMSIAIVPLVGLVLNYTSWGIKELSVLAGLSGLTLLLCGIAYIRRAQLSEDKTFEVSIKNSSFNLISQFLKNPTSKTESILRIFLVLSFILLIGSIGYVNIVPHEKDSFTEFYMLGPEKMAKNYKTEYIQGESGTYIIGITNKEYKTMNYTMDVRLENKSLPLPTNLQNIVLEQNKTFEAPLVVTPSVEGKNMQLEFLLFNETEKNTPYRDLRLWINVTEEV